MQEGFFPPNVHQPVLTYHPDMGAGCMCGLNHPFPAPGADDVHRRFSLGPPSLLLREEAPWKKAPNIYPAWIKDRQLHPSQSSDTDMTKVSISACIFNLKYSENENVRKMSQPQHPHQVKKTTTLIFPWPLVVPEEVENEDSYCITTSIRRRADMTSSIQETRADWLKTWGFS